MAAGGSAKAAGGSGGAKGWRRARAALAGDRTLLAPAEEK